MNETNPHLVSMGIETSNKFRVCNSLAKDKLYLLLHASYKSEVDALKILVKEKHPIKKICYDRVVYYKNLVRVYMLYKEAHVDNGQNVYYPARTYEEWKKHLLSTMCMELNTAKWDITPGVKGKSTFLAEIDLFHEWLESSIIKSEIERLPHPPNCSDMMRLYDEYSTKGSKDEN